MTKLYCDVGYFVSENESTAVGFIGLADMDGEKLLIANRDMSKLYAYSIPTSNEEQLRATIRAQSSLGRYWGYIKTTYELYSSFNINGKDDIEAMSILSIKRETENPIPSQMRDWKINEGKGLFAF